MVQYLTKGEFGLSIFTILEKIALNVFFLARRRWALTFFIFIILFSSVFKLSLRLGLTAKSNKTGVYGAHQLC